MKYVKTFEQHSNVEMTNEEIWGLSKAEKAEKEANKERLSKQFDELKAKLSKKSSTVEQALEFADRYKDDFKGEFFVGSGILKYKPIKDKNPFQGKTGGSSGMGTANG
jgi:hypothetical protein